MKSAVDGLRCWDVLGKVSGLPVCALLGGRYGEDFHLYRAISQEAPDAMAANCRGLPRRRVPPVSLKVGGDPDTDIELIKAVAAVLKPGDRLVRGRQHRLAPARSDPHLKEVRDLDVYIEQPCLTYDECRAVRRQITQPFVLDENIDGIDVLMRAQADGAMDVVNLKISKLGGLTKTKQLRDLCISLGIGMTLEDSWGGDIVTAAIAHLAHSTPTEFLFSSTDFNSYVTRSIADGAPRRVNGRLAASTEPGLGVRPKLREFGAPAVDVKIVPLFCGTDLPACARLLREAAQTGRSGATKQGTHRCCGPGPRSGTTVAPPCRTRAP